MANIKEIMRKTNGKYEGNWRKLWGKHGANIMEIMGQIYRKLLGKYERNYKANINEIKGKYIGNYWENIKDIMGKI